MTLLPFTILSLLHIPFVYSSLPNLNSASITTLGVSDSPCSNSTRTLWEIIWSCAATLFACTWTAIHQNVPGMDERKFTIISRRLGIMMMALIAPELMITWATAQFLSARHTAKAFNDAFGVHHPAHPDIGESTATLLHEFPTSDGRHSSHLSAPHVTGRKFRGWTVTHGFFAWMGGFMLYVNDKPRATLTPDELLGFVREGSVKMPVILEADIEDRSKGDALSKGIAMLQLAWFVIQLVARYIQNLPITLLELDTLAVAALTSIGYGFWWKKPMDVGRRKATASPPRKLTYEEVDMIFSCENWYDLLLTCIYPFSVLWVVPVVITGERTGRKRAIKTRQDLHLRRTEMFLRYRAGLYMARPTSARRIPLAKSGVRSDHASQLLPLVPSFSDSSAISSSSLSAASDSNSTPYNSPRAAHSRRVPSLGGHESRAPFPRP